MIDLVCRRRGKSTGPEYSVSIILLGYSIISRGSACYLTDYLTLFFLSILEGMLPLFVFDCSELMLVGVTPDMEMLYYCLMKVLERLFRSILLLN